MREIKFRAWKNNEMVYWGFELGKLGDFNYNFVFPPTGKSVPYSDIAMQYTGLKDKNGVLIYEGDIVEVRYNGGWTEIGVAEYWEFLGKYVFNEVSDDPFEPKGLFDFNDACPIFVIGNIYENKELLK